MNQSPEKVVGEDVRKVLRSYGWECGSDFDRRYLTDAWVFNLVNIIERLAQERDGLRSALETMKQAGVIRSMVIPIQEDK